MFVVVNSWFYRNVGHDNKIKNTVLLLKLKAFKKKEINDNDLHGSVERSKISSKMNE